MSEGGSWVLELAQVGRLTAEGKPEDGTAEEGTPGTLAPPCRSDMQLWHSLDRSSDRAGRCGQRSVWADRHGLSQAR